MGWGDAGRLEGRQGLPLMQLATELSLSRQQLFLKWQDWRMRGQRPRMETRLNEQAVQLEGRGAQELLQLEWGLFCKTGWSLGAELGAGKRWEVMG